MNFLNQAFLRVIAGELKGRHIQTPKGGDTVRPISDRVKESLFDILAPRIHNQTRVLDMFSGTGAIGIEAISRGAASVLFVEKDIRNVRLIRENALDLDILNRISVLHGEMPQIVHKIKGTYDLMFLDPPFALEISDEIMPIVLKNNLLEPDGLIVIQRFRGSKDLVFQGFSNLRKHKVGDSMLWFFELEKQL